MLVEIESIAKALPFSAITKTDTETGRHIGLARRSPKFQSAPMAEVEAGWLIIQQKREDGDLINMYTITDERKEVITVADD